jgi:DNA-binding MarR family transcriptional regulator
VADQPDGYLIYLIKQVELGVRRPFEHVLAQHDMGVPVYTALSVLRRVPGITSSELARRSFVRPQTMAETVSVLVDSGWVRRERDPAHGRQMLLFITEAGEERARLMHSPVQELDRALSSALTADERAQLVRYLRACRDAMAALPPL